MSIKCALAVAVVFGATFHSHAQEAEARAALIAAREAAEVYPEEAAAHLRKAWGVAQALPSSSKARRQIEAEAERRLRTIDPRGKRMMSARHRSANDLARLLRDYSRAGWKETAVEIIRLIRALDPHVRRDDVTAILKEMTAAEKGAAESVEQAESGESTAIIEWFRDGRVMFREKPWFFSPDTICSPPYPSSEWGLRDGSLLVSSTSVQGDVHIEIEMLTGDMGRAGFCWNFPGSGQGSQPYYILELEDVEAGKLVRFGLMRDEWEELTEIVEVKMDPFKRHEFVPVTIDMNTDTLTVNVGGMEKPIEVEAEFDMDGNLALLVSGSTENRLGAFFRKLKVELK